MSISALALRAPENRDAASSDGGHLRGTPQRGHVSPALVCLDFYVLTAGKTRGSFSVAAALSQLGQTGYRFNGLRVVCWGGLGWGGLSIGTRRGWVGASGFPSGQNAILIHLCEYFVNTDSQPQGPGI